MFALVPITRQRSIRVLQRGQHRMRVFGIGLVARRLGAVNARERAAEVQYVPLQIRRANPAEVVLADKVTGIGRGIAYVAEQGHLREKVSLVLADLGVAGSKASFRRANIRSLLQH